MAIEVFFATNRNRLPDQDGAASFGSLVAPDAPGLAFGSATVANVQFDDPGSGVVSDARVVDFGEMGIELQARLLADGRDVFVFVHGAANTFVDSLQRAAFNVNWINQGPGRDMVALVFSWPATHYNVWNMLGDLRDYRLDQGQARDSAGHMVEFLRALHRLRDGLGERRMSLLAHSMGNYALAFGVERWFRTQRHTRTLFDSVVLAASDVVSTTFAAPTDAFPAPTGERLADLWMLSNSISVYASRNDVLMLASHIANGDWRLGFDGPPNRAETRSFPLSQYAFIDCTTNRDFTSNSLDETHQYYRQSATVRVDVARVLKGVAPPPDARAYDGRRNVYTLPPVSSLIAENPIAPVA